PTGPQPAAQPARVELDPAAVRLVDDIIRKEQVVVFALEWCEFCWSVRKLFTKLGLPWRSIDLDSVTYQQDDLGGKIRAVLAERTGARTIPQVFIGGEHIGGCTDLFDAWRAGSIQRLLSAKGISYDTRLQIDPYSLLPKWLQPRRTA